jgi:uncharacterized membrane protein
MQPAINVAILWLLFAGTHIGLATRRIRTPLAERLGPLGFSMLFSAVAALTFPLLVHYYATVRFDGLAGLDLGRFAPLRAIAIGAIAAGVTLIAASLWRFPASTLALVDPRPFEPQGIERITRHPFFVGVALMGIAHVALAARLVGAVAFGGLAILTIAGAMHQDRKLLANVGAPYAEYLRQTSFVPFAAIATGRQRIVWRELPWAGLTVGLALAFALRSVHASIMSHGGAWVIGVVLGGAGLATLQMLAHRRRATTAHGLARSAPRQG